ncbi:class I SAM-dependent methyltransferase [Streptomyces sp. NPDC021749]|uniref:class I SAM-dependent methyltransferase n=1 Tax=Streptomyces sp. NPDC021749 TaxID=3154905 RepID=UPI0033D7CBFF
MNAAEVAEVAEVLETDEVGGVARVQTPFDVSERRAWAGSAAAYEAGFGRLCTYPVPALLEAVGVGSGMRVLDVGTGPGSVAAAAGARGAEVVAVDAEPGMARRAARAVPGASVYIAELARLPFRDSQFDAVVGNFVLNHVGRPRVALTELRRVTRSGGRIAVTIWAAPAASGQALLGRAVAAAGVPRPADVPALAPEDDFPRTEDGLAALLNEAGLVETGCRSLAWEHHTTAAEWWQGAAAGVATMGRIVTSQGAEGVERIRQQFALLAEEFADGHGGLVLPHRALLAYGRVHQTA